MTPLWMAFFSSIAQDVLHEGFRAQVGVGEAGPLDIPLDELMPCPVGNGGVIPAACAEMHDVVNACRPGVVEECLALPQHVDGVAGDDKQAVNVPEGRHVGTFVVQIEEGSGDATGPEGRCFGG